jgi:hypothetical protein
LGLALGLAALTRGEALILLGILVLPLLWGLRSFGWRSVVSWAAITWLVGALVIAPWITFNLRRFQDPVFMTSSTGAVLSSANCDLTYYGDYIGYYGNCFDQYVAQGKLIGVIPGCDQAAVDAAQKDPTGDEARKCWPSDALDASQRDAPGRQLALQYMKDHVGRLPVVMAARVGRMWDLYVPELGRSDERLGQNVRLNWQVEGRGKVSSEVGVLMFYALLPLGALGGWWLWRRRIPISPLVSMTVVITVTAAFTFGITRYRVPVDVVLVVAGAVGIEWIVDRFRPATDRGTLRRLRPPRRSELADGEAAPGEAGGGAEGASVPGPAPSGAHG